MTIEELQKLKAEMESALCAAMVDVLSDFERRTGYSPHEISCRFVHVESLTTSQNVLTEVRTSLGVHL